VSKHSDEIKLNLEQAIENLQAAKASLEEGEFDAAAARAAETVFHAGSTLLWDEEIEAGKHGDVITLVHERFVDQRRLTKEQGANLSWLFELRNADRRASIHVTFEEAHNAVQIAENFLEATKVILDS
jgi:uncharacterized protein (UPF0332 family)